MGRGAEGPHFGQPCGAALDSLAVETGVDLAQFEDWAEQLAGLAETVADAIDES